MKRSFKRLLYRKQTVVLPVQCDNCKHASYLKCNLKNIKIDMHKNIICQQFEKCIVGVTVLRNAFNNEKFKEEL